MTDYTAKLGARTLTAEVGIPTELAQRMFKKPMSTYLAIIDLQATDTADNHKDDRHAVTLTAIHLEVVTDPDHAEYLRELSQLIFKGRDTTPTLDSIGETEPDEDEFKRRGRALLACGRCLHPAADDRIRHVPEDAPDDTFCTWHATGTEVGTDETDPPDMPADDDPALERPDPIVETGAGDPETTDAPDAAVEPPIDTVTVPPFQDGQADQ